MDKLRALQFFIAAAEEHSFSGASRRLDVSVPAVSKLVSALEHSLGVDLFHRTARGLTLTSHGESYLGACQPLFDQLAAADEALAGERPTCGEHSRWERRERLPSTACCQHCPDFMPAIPICRSRYATSCGRRTPTREPSTFMFNGAGSTRRRTLCAESSGSLASSSALLPAIGPRTVFRCDRWISSAMSACCSACPIGAIHDLWQFERDGQAESVVARGWLVSSHRDVVLDAALEGEGSRA